MSYLEESYLIKADDDSSSVSIKKDWLGNLEIKVDNPGESIFAQIPEELVSKFAYAINRLINK